eukprot:171630-Lingulodinium_polyedra.AAC.1
MDAFRCLSNVRARAFSKRLLAGALRCAARRDRTPGRAQTCRGALAPCPRKTRNGKNTRPCTPRPSA